MEALSPRSTNIQVRTQQQVSKKDQLAAQAAAQRKAQRQKEHPEPPPPQINEPDGLDGEAGERYTVGKFLGKGGFAICYEGELQDRASRPSGHRYALKIVKSVMPQAKMAEKFRTELQIHSKMHHPSIVDFHRAFTFEGSTYVVLGLCENGSLMDMVRKRRYLTEPEVRRYVLQTAGAIKYMHHKNVIHRDLKMGNIFLDGEMNVKIGDFGLAALLVSDKEYSANRRRTLCGTPNYIAPEVLEKGQKGHDYKVDIWSLGIIIFAMLTGIPPFQSKTQEEIYRKVKARDYLWPSVDKCPNEISQDAQDLVASLLVLAEDRPEPDDIVSHDFFKRGIVPDSLPSSARFVEPTFPAWSPQLGGTEEAFWLGQWTRLCRECGVGNKNKRETFALVGEELHKTTYQECRLEEKAGRTPIVPIPANTVYRPFPDSKSWPNVGRGDGGQDLLQLARAKEPLRGVPSKTSYATVQDAIGRGAKTLPRSAVIDLVTPRASDRPAVPESRPRPEVKSHAATLREQTRPTLMVSTRYTKSSLRSVAEPVEETQPAAMPSLKESARSTRLAQDSVSASSTATTGRITRSRSVQGGLVQSLSQGMLRGTAPRRNGLPKSASSRALKSEISPVVEEDEAVKPRPETRIRARAHAVATETVANQVAELNEAMAKVSVEPVSTTLRKAPSTRSRNDPVATLSRSRSIKESSSSSRPLPPKPTSLSSPTLISPNEPSHLIPSSPPSSILAALSTSLFNIEVALNLKLDLQLTSTSTTKLPSPLPIVFKWIDYTTKYGIGYVLNDGSVGCLFNTSPASTAPGTKNETVPTTCVIVRDGEAHAKRRHWTSYPDRQQIVPTSSTQPIEFIENRGAEGLHLAHAQPSTYAVDRPEEGNVVERLLVPSAAVDAHDLKKRQMLVTWRKFANYMADPVPDGTVVTPSSPSHHRASPAAPTGPFVRFYQRFYDVGVWGFADGGFQFNFPDHTKLVLSATALHADFYHLPAATARHLRRTGGYLPRDGCLDERGVLRCPLKDMVEGRHGGEGFSEVVESNDLVGKVVFVREAMLCWRAGGGLGRYARAEEQLRVWEGARALKAGKADGEGRGEKRVWVTVGATGDGGDWRVEDRGGR